MAEKTGHLMCEQLKAQKNDILPVLKDLSKITLAEGKKFDVCDKASKDLSDISCNAMLSFSSSGGDNPKKPLKVGVLFSGGPASGGHNVVVGLYDAIKEMDPKSEVIGFMNGPDGLLKADGKVLSKEDIDSVRNQGGFYLLGTSRTKFEKEEDMAKCSGTIKKFNLDGLLIIGGDDSNTNAAVLAEYFAANGTPCQPFEKRRFKSGCGRDTKDH